MSARLFTLRMCIRLRSVPFSLRCWLRARALCVARFTRRARGCAYRVWFAFAVCRSLVLRVLRFSGSLVLPSFGCHYVYYAALLVRGFTDSAASFLLFVPVGCTELPRLRWIVTGTLVPALLPLVAMHALLRIPLLVLHRPRRCTRCVVPGRCLLLPVPPSFWFSPAIRTPAVSAITPLPLPGRVSLCRCSSCRGLLPPHWFTTNRINHGCLCCLLLLRCVG